MGTSNITKQMSDTKITSLVFENDDCSCTTIAFNKKDIVGLEYFDEDTFIDLNVYEECDQCEDDNNSEEYFWDKRTENIGHEGFEIITSTNTYIQYDIIIKSINEFIITAKYLTEVLDFINNNKFVLIKKGKNSKIIKTEDIRSIKIYSEK